MSAAVLWIVDLAMSAEHLERCAPLLDGAERDRAERFLRPADRARYVASHAALRLVLAEALGCAPPDITLEAGPAGKPALAGPRRRALDFNLSHSGERALIGVAHGVAIGVDVEAIRPLPDALRIARAHFAPDEAAALAAVAPETMEGAFFGLWTRKEAVVKALGSGLSLPLDRFSISVPPEPPRLLRMAQAGAWTLAEIDAGLGYAATVAVRAADTALTLKALPQHWAARLG